MSTKGKRASRARGARATMSTPGRPKGESRAHGARVVMNEVFLCDGVRTPIGRYGGALASVRTDDLAAIPLKALVARNAGVDWAALDDVYSAAPTRRARTTATSRAWRCCWRACRRRCPAATVNRLCGSGLDAVALVRARDPRRRSRADDRRRRREHDARAVRDAEGRRARSRAATRSTTRRSAGAS